MENMSTLYGDNVRDGDNPVSCRHCGTVIELDTMIHLYLW